VPNGVSFHMKAGEDCESFSGGVTFALR
jgi:hypothetical protein